MATMTMPDFGQQVKREPGNYNTSLRIGSSFVISPAMYNRLPALLPHGYTASTVSFDQPYCYDIDLDTPPINTLPIMAKECMEADNLTPTLLSPGGLGEYRVTVDGNEVIQPELDGSIFTSLKSRPTNRSPNSDSAFEDLSDTSVTSHDGWDVELALGRCVRYADVHMELSTSSNINSESDKILSTPNIKKESEDDSMPPIEIMPKSEPAQEPNTVLKRPKNGFIRFAMKYRKQVALNHPRLDNRDISRILGVRWRKLTALEKADYEEAFHKEMVERKSDHPQWRYGGSRQHEDIASWEPIPTRLRPRDKLKRRKIPKLTRPYMRRKSVIQTNWVQCDRCDKWRQLPHGVDMTMMPHTWYCEYNWAPKNHCDADEDQEDPEEELLTQQLTQQEDNYYSSSAFVAF